MLRPGTASSGQGSAAQREIGDSLVQCSSSIDAGAHHFKGLHQLLPSILL